MARTALFVIDVQVSLARNALTEITHAARIRDAGTQVLERARQSIDAATGVPDLEIVFVQHEEGTDVGDLVRGSEAWELVFKPREENKWERLVGKDVRDTFTSNPDLAEQLKSSGISTIVAFGIQSECCVLSTCLGALAAGFKLILLSGAHSTYSTSDKSSETIERDVESQLTCSGAQIVPWEVWNPSAS